jgi:Fuc2NAc and GlcNAc transferase
MRSELLGLLAMLGVALFSGLVAETVRRHAGKMGLLHAPNHRSSHTRPTPHGGGLGIALGGTLAGLGLAVAYPETAAGIVPIAWFSILISAVGFWDDIRPLPAGWRFVVQLAVCLGILIALPGAHPDWGGAPALLVLLLGGVWWVNLFNFMDGIDGLAGVQAVFMFVAGAVLAVMFAPESAGHALWFWMWLLAAAVLAFLRVNWPPAKIFMGDVGSIYLGFLLFCYCLMTVRAGWLTYPAWLILSALFVTDATLTLLRRIMRGERWFEAHRNHLYQRLALRWKAHRPVTLLALALNLALLAPLAWVALRWPEWAWWIVCLVYLILLAAMLASDTGNTIRADKGNGETT